MSPRVGLATTQPQGDVPAKFALHCFSPGHDDLFSCCQSKNFRGASYTYFAVHITGALVLFMTDGIVVSSADGGILSEQSYMAFFLPKITCNSPNPAHVLCLQWAGPEGLPVQQSASQSSSFQANRSQAEMCPASWEGFVASPGLCGVAARLVLTWPVQSWSCDVDYLYAVEVSSHFSQEAKPASFYFVTNCGSLMGLLSPQNPETSACRDGPLCSGLAACPWPGQSHRLPRV